MTPAPLVRFAVIYALADGRFEVSPTLHGSRREAIVQAAALAAETSGPEIHVVLVEVPTAGEPVDGIGNWKEVETPHDAADAA